MTRLRIKVKACVLVPMPDLTNSGSVLETIGNWIEKTSREDDRSMSTIGWQHRLLYTYLHKLNYVTNINQSEATPAIINYPSCSNCKAGTLSMRQFCNRKCLVALAGGSDMKEYSKSVRISI